MTGVVFHAQRAPAHTPHDTIWDVEVSPDFPEDGVVYTISREYLLKSSDRGTTWKRLVRGITNRLQLSSIAVSSRNKRVLYVSSRGNGVFKSVDGGESWSDVSGGLVEPFNKSIQSLVSSPHSEDVVLAIGAGEGLLSTTTDGGDAWTTIDLGSAVTTAAFAPDVPGLVFVGDAGGAVHVSNDNGRAWEQLEAGFENSGRITSIAVSPAFSSDVTLLVGTEKRGVFVTLDGGETFEPSSAGLTDLRVRDIALSPQFATDRSLWASTWNDGVFESSDGGATWSAVSEGLTNNEMADDLGVPHFYSLAVSPTADQGSARTLFVAGFDGLFRSASFGRLVWEPLDTQLPQQPVAVAVSPAYADDSTVAVATYLNGAFLSEDGGKTWTPVNKGMAAHYEWVRRPDYLVRLTSLGFFPSYADDTTMFAGARGFFFVSTDRGRSWEARIPDGLLAENEFPPDYLLVRFSPEFEQDHTIVAGTDGGKVLRSEDGGRNFSLVAELGEEVRSLAFSPEFASDDTLFAGTAKGILRSTDRGKTWTKIRGTGFEVTGLTVGSANGNLSLLAGTPNGLRVSNDGGEHFRRLDVVESSDRVYVEAVVASPAFADDGTVLVSVRGRGLFQSDDGAETFRPVGQDLFADGYVLASFYHPTSEPIVFSPSYSEDHTIFGIAETRVFRSTDGGLTWEGLDLPVTTHDTAESAAPVPLLRTPRWEGEPSVQEERSFETPVGNLSVRRVLAAAFAGVGTFAALVLAGLGGRSWRRRLAVSLGGAIVVILVALVVLAE